MPEQEKPRKLLQYDLPPEAVGEYANLIYAKDSVEKCLMYASNKEERGHWAGELTRVGLQIQHKLEELMLTYADMDVIKDFPALMTVPMVDVWGNRLIFNIPAEESKDEVRDML